MCRPCPPAACRAPSQERRRSVPSLGTQQRGNERVPAHPGHRKQQRPVHPVAPSQAGVAGGGGGGLGRPAAGAIAQRDQRQPSRVETRPECGGARGAAGVQVKRHHCSLQPAVPPALGGGRAHTRGRTVLASALAPATQRGTHRRMGAPVQKRLRRAPHHRGHRPSRERCLH
eukprot:scaffold9773_cov101-Isochrysis_galbana.AAC.1